jgi:hypothetical protein
MRTHLRLLRLRLHQLRAAVLEEVRTRPTEVLLYLLAGAAIGLLPW